MPIRVAVDAAGEEPGCRVIVDGVLAAVAGARSEGAGFQPVLYGIRDQISDTLRRAGATPEQFEVVETPQAVEMHEEPAEALRTKPDSSILRAVTDLAQGKVDAFVSMGNTGAIVGACRAYLGRVRWIGKPALGVPLPQLGPGRALLLDVGASPDPKPGHLLQFAAMGAVFVELVYGLVDPRVALLNIGVESHKGDERTRDTYKLLSRSPLNFVGNIEGGEMFLSRADVIVTTGFVGNILLKFTESIPALVADWTRDDGGRPEIAAGMAKLDYRRYGGASLLGVDGTVVIGHGRSNADAVARALRWAWTLVSQDVLGAMRDRVFRTRRALWLSNPFARGEGTDD
ncbi:MAG: Phosphate acyltransferase [Calditrichaeota bacterium]|nr:Phosphate acyltransferase [Calditrichota bacterium]